MQWHYNRNVGLADVDYKISSLIINPHGIFFYSLGSNLYVHDLKISNYQFFNSTVLEKNVYWQIDPIKLNFIRKYEII